MIIKLSKALLLLCFLFSATSQALPILQADAFTEGDNKAALEIDTGLIWMDFGVNSHRPYSDIVASLSSDYVGWRLANTLEVKHLWLGIFGGLPEWQPWNMMHTSMRFRMYWELMATATTVRVMEMEIMKNG